MLSVATLSDHKMTIAVKFAAANRMLGSVAYHASGFLEMLNCATSGDWCLEKNRTPPLYHRSVYQQSGPWC